MGEPASYFQAAPRRDFDSPTLVAHFRVTLRLRKVQCEFLALICVMSRERGHTYFLQEYVADHFRVSTRTVRTWTENLAQRGLIRKRRSQQGLELIPEWSAFKLPSGGQPLVRPWRRERSSDEQELRRGWSLAIMQRDGRCMECGCPDGLHAHHIFPQRSYQDLQWDLLNGISLCAPCHQQLAGRELEHAPRLLALVGASYV